MRDLADVIDDVKHRLQLQQRVVIAERTSERTLTEGDLLSIRAELDALWEAVAALCLAIEAPPCNISASKSMSICSKSSHTTSKFSSSSTTAATHAACTTAPNSLTAFSTSLP